MHRLVDGWRGLSSRDRALLVPSVATSVTLYVLDVLVLLPRR